MEACVPVKARKKQTSYLKHPKIVRARAMLEAASQNSNTATFEEDYHQLKEAKILLYDT
jgi:hypothetical protein